MAITFGPVSPNRLPEVAELFLRIKATAENPITRAASMQWKAYARHPWFAQPRCRAIEKDGRIAAFGCIAPLRFLAEGQIVDSHQIIDWIAGSEVPGGGMLVYRNCISEVGTMVATTASEAARAILARSPLFRSAGPAIYYRRVFRFWNPAHRDKKTPLRMGRDLLLQSKQTPLPDAKEWVARRSSLSRVWQPEEQCIAIRRSLEWFRYLIECPEAQVQEGVLEREGQPHGHFLTARRGSRIRIVDLVAQGAEQEPAFSACLALLQSEGASEAQVSSSLPLRQQVFESCGMSKFREEPVWIADPKSRLPKQLAVETSFLTGDAFYV
jgi:hypothetical protein